MTGHTPWREIRHKKEVEAEQAQLRLQRSERQNELEDVLFRLYELVADNLVLDGEEDLLERARKILGLQ